MNIKNILLHSFVAVGLFFSGLASAQVKPEVNPDDEEMIDCSKPTEEQKKACEEQKEEPAKEPTVEEDDQ